MDRAELVPDGEPGGAGAAFADVDQQEDEPAQQHVGAYSVVEAVVDRPQAQRGFHRPEGTLGFQQVLAAERDILGGRVGVGGGERVLPVELGLGDDLDTADGQPAGGRVLLESAPEAGVVTQGTL
ncbi:hypothetical protein ACFY0A_37710 [Streptomyces sp. NPDC001698]|uniref:hypothetical protein n=1 Tax=Streptomyces sp. NPDC001698 TaxID=3364601 RepID=UPI0036B6E9BC